MLLTSNFKQIKITTALSGKEALDIIEKNFWSQRIPFFDYIFMDLNMNKMDGYETTLLLREKIEKYILNEGMIEKKEIRTKIFLHTATDIQTLEPKILDVFDGQVDKPLSINNLEQILGRRSKNLQCLPS